MKRPLLERLRDKPKEVRVQVSFLGALGITGVIAVLWGIMLPARLQIPSGGGVAVEENAGMSGFFTEAKNNLGQIIGASDDPKKQEDLVLPETGTYREGIPAAEPPSYNDSPFQDRAPAEPAGRREVRIATSTEE